MKEFSVRAIVPDELFDILEIHFGEKFSELEIMLDEEEDELSLTEVRLFKEIK
jgi:hypothetical protein